MKSCEAVTSVLPDPSWRAIAHKFFESLFGLWKCQVGNGTIRNYSSTTTCHHYKPYVYINIYGTRSCRLSKLFFYFLFFCRRYRFKGRQVTYDYKINPLEQDQDAVSTVSDQWSARSKASSVQSKALNHHQQTKAINNNIMDASSDSTVVFRALKDFNVFLGTSRSSTNTGITEPRRLNFSSLSRDSSLLSLPSPNTPGLHRGQKRNHDSIVGFGEWQN